MVIVQRSVHLSKGEERLRAIGFSPVVERFLAPLCVVLVGVANYYVFRLVPSEQVMGAVQRIFYFHVGAALACYVAVGILFVASVVYLVNRGETWDLVGRSASGVAFVLATTVLLTGMIWGHSAWNTWWRWEPRLVSFLALWLLLFSYSTLRAFVRDTPSEGTASAVVGILCAINVPIVIFSVRLLSHTEQLHPQVVANQGLRDARYVTALAVASVAVIAVSLLLTLIRFRQLLAFQDARSLSLTLDDAEFALQPNQKRRTL